jgi:hypothetical protein
MPKLIAIDTIYGDYRGGTADGVRTGLIHKGEIFDASEADALRLESRGIAMRYFDPPAPVESFVPYMAQKQITAYETKIIPAEDISNKHRNRR